MLEAEKNYISPGVKRPYSQDYDRLREAGIEHIQKLSSKLWTDYNIHDPGVSILELLCYAITDLGYRTNFKINDILTPEGKTGPELKNTFFTAKEILTCHSTTVNDYRKLILDKIPAIRNVWFLPAIDEAYKPGIFVSKYSSELTMDQGAGINPLKLNGLYRIKYELHEAEWYRKYDDGKSNEETSGSSKVNENFRKNCLSKTDLLLKKKLDLIDKNEFDIISKEIKTLYLENRNLSEDIQCVTPIGNEYVGVCTDIELKRDADPVKVKKEVYRTIYEYITPQLNFYTIEELLEKGRTIEEIFQGSVSERGFLDYEEIEKFQRKEVLYTSDLINLLSDIPGIASINKLHFSLYKTIFTAEGEKIDIENLLVDGADYCLHLHDKEKSFKFRLDILEGSDNGTNNIDFFFDGLNIPVKIKYGDVKLNEVAPVAGSLTDFKNDLPKPKGKFRDIERFYSIQNEFPVAYALGMEGISDSTTDARKSQRLQLKAYLVFFEQLLVDYLSQLNNAANLLSFSNVSDRQTYFFQKITGDEILDLSKLRVNGYDGLFEFTTENGKEICSYQKEIIGQDENNIFDRRNRFLNLLLARFGEEFTEFSIDQFMRKSSNGETGYEPHEIIKDKKSYLRNYPKISSERFHAFDYNKTVWNTNNISGYEYKVLKKLGVDDPYYLNSDELTAHCLIHPVFGTGASGELEMKSPPEFYDNRKTIFNLAFGIHLMEHILLRPRFGNNNEKLLDARCDDEYIGEDCPCRDPYSSKVTAVLPGWLDISMDLNFRRYIETQLREQLPAHLAMKICWVSPVQMFEFEKNYAAFTDCLRQFSKKYICYENLDSTSPAFKANYTQSLNNLVETINNLRNIYPPAYLIECEDIEIENGEIKKNPVILDRTALKGNIENDFNWIKLKSKDGKYNLTKKQIENESKFFSFIGKCGKGKSSIKIIEPEKKKPEEKKVEPVKEENEIIETAAKPGCLLKFFPFFTIQKKK